MWPHFPVLVTLRGQRDSFRSQLKKLRLGEASQPPSGRSIGPGFNIKVVELYNSMVLTPLYKYWRLILCSVAPMRHHEAFNKCLPRRFWHPAPLCRFPLIPRFAPKFAFSQKEILVSPFLCALGVNFFVLLSFLFMKAEETEFQQASNGNPE